jgi:hypothetical protein
LKKAEISSLAPKQKHFETSRRKGSPQQSGRTPDAPFLRAIETPPARKGRKKAGAFPSESRFTADNKAREKDHDCAE